MTIHIRYDHQCASCTAHYIPYDKDVPCPQCGLVEAERTDFIPEAAGSAAFNTMDHPSGGYLPGAWYVSSLGDHILSIIFNVLEKHRTAANGRSFSDVATDFLGGMQWGSQPYLRDHIHAISCRVRQQLDLTESKVDSTVKRHASAE